MYSLYTRQLSKEDERTHGTVDPDDSVRRWVYDDFCSDLTTNQARAAWRARDEITDNGEFGDMN